MDWQALRSSMPADHDLPPRAARLVALTSVLDGSMYDHLTHSFADEPSGAGEYISLSQRRPSVRSGLCRTVVDDSVSLLLSDGHRKGAAAARAVDGRAQVGARGGAYPEPWRSWQDGRPRGLRTSAPHRVRSRPPALVRSPLRP